MVGAYSSKKKSQGTSGRCWATYSQKKAAHTASRCTQKIKVGGITLKSSSYTTITSPSQRMVDERMETMLCSLRGRSKSNIAKQVCMQRSNPVWETMSSFFT